MAKEKTIEFGARVPESDYDAFVNLFDDGRGRVVYGASTWLIRTALSYFNEEVSKNDSPVLRDNLRKSVERMIQENRNGD